jgi:hypothetical protein
MLAKTVNDRNTPAQVRLFYPPSLPPSLPSSLQAITRDDVSRPESVQANNKDIFDRLEQLPAIIACYPSFGGQVTWVPTNPKIHFWRWKEEGEDDAGDGNGKGINGLLTGKRRRRGMMRGGGKGTEEDKAGGEAGGEDVLSPEVNPDGTPLQPTPPLERMFTPMNQENCPVLRKGRGYGR